MAAKALPSPEVLRQLLRYEPDTGKLFWLPRPLEMFKSQRSAKIWNTRYACAEAFIADSHGYRSGSIFGHRFLAHRVAWAITTGKWPAADIDHVNCDPGDNRIQNLRPATRSENRRNSRAGTANASGVKGVSFNKAKQKWVASIGHNRQVLHLGTFNCRTAAALSYAAASAKIHGAFGRVA